MAYFPRFFHRYLIIPLTALVISSCERDGSAVQPSETTHPVAVEIKVPETRALANGQGHHVDRILILPFRKSAEGMTNDDANFVPAYSQAVQMDVAQFPVNQAMIHLLTGTTYKVVVIGYAKTDFNFADRTDPANKFDVGSVSAPTTLANFHLLPKSPTAVPEFFTCTAQAFAGNTAQGTAFKPELITSLQGTLNRLVSGFSVTITQVPAFVKSVTLRAENLVKSSLATTGTATQWQTAGDGGNRTLAKLTPANGTVVFTHYLLPTFATYKTGFFLDVEFGLTTQTYTVKAADGVAVSGNKFIFNPNEAINLTGDYTTVINFGFTTNNDINLDDDLWDGIQ